MLWNNSLSIVATTFSVLWDRKGTKQQYPQWLPHSRGAGPEARANSARRQAARCLASPAILSARSVRLWRRQEQAGREAHCARRAVTGEGQALPAASCPHCCYYAACEGEAGGDIFLLKTLGDFYMYSGPRLGTLSYLWIKKPIL